MDTIHCWECEFLNHDFKSDEEEESYDWGEDIEERRMKFQYYSQYSSEYHQVYNTFITEMEEEFPKFSRTNPKIMEWKVSYDEEISKDKFISWFGEDFWNDVTKDWEVEDG